MRIYILLCFLLVSGCLSAAKQQNAYTNSEIAIQRIDTLQEWFVALSRKFDGVQERLANLSRDQEILKEKHAVQPAESTSLPLGIPWWGWVLGAGGATGGGAVVTAMTKKLRGE